MPKPKRGLGKGLEALFADNDTPDVSVSALALSEIEPNSEQPRRDFSTEALDALAASIKENGGLQPRVVDPRPDRKSTRLNYSHTQNARMPDVDG